MFTGIVEALGTVGKVLREGEGLTLTIHAREVHGDLEIGHSICLNGVCLTAVELPGDGFVADVSNETLSLTTLGNLKAGSRVNLEKALTMATRLGGHLVRGMSTAWEPLSAGMMMPVRYAS